MRKLWKWIGIIVGSLLGLLVVLLIGLAIYANTQFHKVVDRSVYEIVADTSPEGLARGEYLVRDAIGCQGCHGPVVAEGEEADRDAPLVGQAEEVSMGPISALFAASNLTPDEATGLGSWTDGEIARAIREGIDRDGVALAIMPSTLFRNMSDADVAAIVGYLRSLEPVHNEIPPVEANLVGKLVLSLGLIEPANPAEEITEPIAAAEPGTAEYGGYMVSIIGCMRCHGETLAGGPLPFAEEGAPLAANLTPAGDLASWTVDEFVLAVQTGVAPDGQLHSSMPRFERLQVEDLQAIFLYLQSLPASQPEE